MKNGTECVYPHTQEVLSDGRVAQWSDSGIDLRTHIAIEAMKAFIGRMDSGLFSPKEVADKACVQAEALLVRLP